MNYLAQMFFISMQIRRIGEVSQFARLKVFHQCASGCHFVAHILIPYIFVIVFAGACLLPRDESSSVTSGSVVSRLTRLTLPRSSC